MRLVLGLDWPTGGAATINGRPYRELSQPLRTVGALLEARAVHPGRSARDHLLFLAQTHGLPRGRVQEMIDLVGLGDAAARRVGTFSLGMTQRLGIAVALRDPGGTRAVVGTGLYLAVLGLFAMAIGGLVRHTAGAITGVIGFVLVLAPLAQLLPGSLGKHIHAYLPSEAGQLITQAHERAGQLLSPWQGFGVFCLWTAALLAGAAFLLMRRDA